MMTPIIISLVALITISLIVFWIIQFKQLMNMETAEFKDKNDKLIWAIVLLTMNFFGALLFYFIVLGEAQHELSKQSYNDAIEKFPEHESHISEALDLPLHKKLRLEKRFTALNNDKLNREYQRGKYNLSKPEFGVLITIMNDKKLFEA